MLFVPKQDRKLQLVVDYRALNAITTKDRYTLPLIHEIQDRFQGLAIFTKIDLCRAYNLVRIKEKEEWKTAFRTRYRYYKYTIIPIGLTNALASWQRLINNVLREYLDVFVVIYLDNIFIYSKEKKQHIEHVRKVFK